MVTQSKTFNPKEWIIKLRGQDYLPVAARLMWLNADAQRFSIETTFVALEDTYAIAQATVTIMDEAGQHIRSATAAKREDQKHFADYLEKAQTGAIGRALGMLGFGTQFAPEFDELDSRDPRIVDSPITRPADRPRIEAAHGELAGVVPASKLKPTVKPSGEAGADDAEISGLPEYDHAAVSEEDLFSEAKVKRLYAIGGKLFGLKGDGLEARLCSAASKILRRQVVDLHAMHWKDGGEVMKALEDQAVKRGVWEKDPARA